MSEADSLGDNVQVTRGPSPEPEELAAIVAAVQVTMAAAAASAEELEPSPRWRFSGRWWARPVASRRDRPSAL